MTAITAKLRSTQLAQLLAAIRQLDMQDQLLLMQELANGLRQQIGTTPAKRRITEFRGVGKQAWSGIDVTDYLRREREAWY